MDKPFLNQVLEKTRLRKLHWEGAAASGERVAAFGGRYLLRVRGPNAHLDPSRAHELQPDIRVALETAEGQVIDEGDVRTQAGPSWRQLLIEVWNAARFDGMSGQEAAHEATEALAAL